MLLSLVFFFHNVYLTQKKKKITHTNIIQRYADELTLILPILNALKRPETYTTMNIRNVYDALMPFLSHSQLQQKDETPESHQYDPLVRFIDFVVCFALFEYLVTREISASAYIFERCYEDMSDLPKGIITSQTTLDGFSLADRVTYVLGGFSLIFY
jgi:hypothetical protein